jgi:hypothetical protein
VSGEAVVTLSDGATSMRWWAGVWPRTERARLYDALRERGVDLTFTSTSVLGERDVERHAVVYVFDGGFLVPVVKRLPDGTLDEFGPVKRVPVSALKLSFALIDRLHDPIDPAVPSDDRVDDDALAAAAGIDRETFAETALRLVIEGTREAWTILDDGAEAVWSAPRHAVKDADLDEVIFDLLGLDSTPQFSLPRFRRGTAKGESQPDA